MKYLAAFFKNVKWWNMAPHPELVKEYPQPFCLANPGEEYVLYLRYGGVAKLKWMKLLPKPMCINGITLEQVNYDQSIK